MAQGHDERSLTNLRLDTKNDLIRLHRQHRIGWQAEALRTYMVLCSLNRVENSIRALQSGMSRRRLSPAKMVDYEELFGLKAPVMTSGFAGFEAMANATP